MKNRSSLPTTVLWILKRLVPSDDYPYLNGNMEALYEVIRDSRGKFLARLWLIKEMICSLPGFFQNILYWRIIMLKNIVLMTIRMIKKNKLYSFINIFGLSIGLAASLLLFLFIQDELGYDRFHSRLNNISQVYSESQFSDGKTQINTGSYYPLAGVLRDECPEIQAVCRFQTAAGIVIQQGKQMSTNDVVGLADPSFFDVFSFPLDAGDPETALRDNQSLILTKKMAEKLFGTEDPIGKTLTINHGFDVRVTGIMKNVPRQSSLQFDCIAPFALSFAPEFKEPDHWGGNPFQTYILTNKQVNRPALEEKIGGITSRHNPQKSDFSLRFFLFPFSKFHLYSPQGGGLIGTLVITTLIAVIILIIACLNFTNLSTARASIRAKEVGVRKAVGAHKRDLLGQFLGESLMMAVFSFSLALVLLILFLPTFNSLMGRQFSPAFLLNPTVILGFFSILLLTALAAGGYPAMFLSAFQPAAVIHGKTAKRGGNRFRRVLVVTQFSFAIFLIICSVVLFRQMSFIRDKDLGFNKDHLLCIPDISPEIQKHYDTFRDDLLASPSISGVTRSLQGPWNIGSTVRALDWDGKNPEETVFMHWDYIGYNYFETMGITLIDGRSFSREFGSDRNKGYIVNEEAARLMGMKDPIGQRLSVFREEGTIIGVVRDFHFQPLYNAIKPFVFILKPETANSVFIRIKTGNSAQALPHISSVYKQFESGIPLRHLFFEEIQWQYIYTSERQISRIAGYLTILAVILSCLGLFGLTAFIAERRQKEIGIRKVLGANSLRIVSLLAGGYTRWVLLANLFAWPAAYLITRSFLTRYAFHARLGLELFVFSGSAALSIALLTVLFMTIRAARKNPADSLRLE